MVHSIEGIVSLLIFWCQVDDLTLFFPQCKSPGIMVNSELTSSESKMQSAGISIFDNFSFNPKLLVTCDSGCRLHLLSSLYEIEAMIG